MDGLEERHFSRCQPPRIRQPADGDAASLRGREAGEFVTLEWVDWFNNRLLLEPIGNIPPTEVEERHYAMLEQPVMAA
jgi:hypothetical protein